MANKATLTMIARYGENFFVLRARKGGKELLNKYGIEYMRKLGSRGGEAYIAKGLNHGLRGMESNSWL